MRKRFLEVIYPTPSRQENLMLFEAGDASYVKLIDFGFCKVFDSPDGLRAAVGSPYYVAREVLLASEPDAPGYGPACDLWSLGVIAYMMLCGQVSTMASMIDDARA